MYSKPQLISIGDRLETMRTLAGISKKDVYEFLGTTKFLYKQVRIGKKRLPVEWAYKFHFQYGFNLNWIYKGMGDMLNPQIIQESL